MKFTVNRDLLLKALARVQGVIEKRSNIPILSMVLLHAAEPSLEIAATDLEIAYRQSMPANIEEEGSIATHGRKLFEILRESSREEIEIASMDNNWIRIFDGTAHFNLAGLPGDEYPNQVEPSDVEFVELDSGLIGDMITKTIYAVTLEEAGFKLSGIYTEKVTEGDTVLLRMVGTDGHRLSLVDKPVTEIEKLNLPTGVMIPKKGMVELNRLASEGGTIQIGFKQNNCVVKKVYPAGEDNAVIMMRLLDSKFPDYRAVIPRSAEHKVNIDRTLLLQAMRKMLILSNERYKAVKITLADGVLRLHSTNPELGEAEEKIQVDYQDEPLELAFNARYFIDVLQNMESSDVELGFVDSSKPCVIRGKSDAGFLGLIMPMRI